ncbi:hypothetical protein O23A_p3332 [Aeromonas salmonicida]|nr:hypothetical protein O23A_p3332 [Aeromonas salmonicida]
MFIYNRKQYIYIAYFRTFYVFSSAIHIMKKPIPECYNKASKLSILYREHSWFHRTLG